MDAIRNALDRKGDMFASTYDPEGKQADVFGYADTVGEAAREASRPKDWTPTAGEVAFSDGTTFQEKYDAGELRGQKGDTGEQGPAGVLVTAGGLYGFMVSAEGMLSLVCEDEATPPDIELAEDGHLYINIEEDET